MVHFTLLSLTRFYFILRFIYILKDLILSQTINLDLSQQFATPTNHNCFIMLIHTRLLAHHTWVVGLLFVCTCRPTCSNMNLYRYPECGGSMDYLEGAHIGWTNFRHISDYILAPRWWCIWPLSARCRGGTGCSCPPPRQSCPQI